MTIGKMIKTVVAVLLCAVCLMTASCSPSNDSALEALALLSAADTEEVRAARLYRIVVSGTCDSSVADAADTLADGILDKTGIECVVMYDNESVTQQSGVVEILLGNVERAAARVMLDRLNRDDYVCRYAYDGSFFIGGRADSATCEAINKYIEEYLPYITSASLISEGGGFEYICEYPLGAATVCGFELDDYVFLCEDELTLEIARHVREEVSDRCGTYPNIAVGETAVSGRKEIIFTAASEDTQAYISKNNEDIIIHGTGTYGLSVAADRFCRMLFENSGALDISDELQLSYADAKLDVLSLVLDVTDGDEAVNILNEIHTRINKTQPDVVILGAVNSTVWSTLAPSVPQGYTVMAQMLTDGRYIPVMYKTEAFALEEELANVSGGLGEQTVTLVRKTNGERITVSSLVGENAAERAAHSAAILERLGDGTDNTLLLFSCAEYADGSFDVADKRVHAWYNSGVTVGETALRHCLFTPASSLDVYALSTYKSEDGNISYLAFTVRARYSSSFLELISSENIVD